MKKLAVLFTAALLLPCCILGGCGKTQKTEYIEGREVISQEEVNTFAEGVVNTYGRVRLLSKGLYLPNAGTAVEFSFYGTQLSARLQNSGASSQYYRVIVDGAEGDRKYVRSNKDIELCKDLEEGIHTVRIVKCNASQNREILVKSVSTDGKFLRPEKKTGLKLEFIGDSITAGSGTLGKPGDAGSFDNSDVTRGYAYLTASALGADYSIVATDGICISGKMTLDVNMLEMYTYYSSTDSTPYPFPDEQDVVVLSMGTNDTYYKSSHPEYKSEQFIADYTALLTLIRDKNPNAYIVCAFGLMFENATTENDIQTAIEQFDDEKVSYIKLPTGVNGAQAHPSEEDAKLQCVPLIEHIQNLLDEE